MKFFRIICLVFFYILVSCTEKEEPGIEETFWVYSFPVPPNMAATFKEPVSMVTFGEEFEYRLQSWEVIPLEIESYVFKPTFFQKLLVLKVENSSSRETKRKLIRVLEEEKDYIDLLEGSWKLNKYQGEIFPNANFPNGHKFSFSAFLRMGVSSDGCNQITLEITKVSSNRILSFGSMTSTSKACSSSDPTISPFPGLGYNFIRKGNKLTFFSDEEEEIAVWEKIN